MHLLTDHTTYDDDCRTWYTPCFEENLAGFRWVQQIDRNEFRGGYVYFSPSLGDAAEAPVSCVFVYIDEYGDPQDGGGCVNFYNLDVDEGYPLTTLPPPTGQPVVFPSSFTSRPWLGTSCVGWSAFVFTGDEYEQFHFGTFAEAARFAAWHLECARQIEADLAACTEWVIQADFSGEYLYWSLQDGWTSRGRADIFSNDEHDRLSLPIGGQWVKA